MKKKNAQKRLEEYMKVHFGGKTALGIVLFHVLEEGGGTRGEANYRGGRNLTT